MSKKGKIDKVPFVISGVVSAVDSLAVTAIVAIFQKSAVALAATFGISFAASYMMVLFALAACKVAAEADDAMGLR